MCIAAFAWDAHPRWQLVVAANRDESHDRPAAPLARWADGSGIIAGRDLKGSGTWLGLTESGRLALVTNVHTAAPPDDDRPSRGALVTALLAGRDSAAGQLPACNPCNLLLIQDGGARLLTNAPAAAQVQLAPGIHGLSNGPLDPPWLKTRRLTAALGEWLDSAAPDCAPLFDALLDRSPFPEASPLPGAPPLMTSIFVANPAYGTRCSTVVAVDRAGNGRISERSFAPDSAALGEVTLDFRWP